ncbi:iron(III) transport system substrate-binding protein [Octadecabacter temperatus]|uniref:Putative binding protein component of ABC iron transporter n=1 Tax=Octadecabacter temperatus TaxID=1458307 RepID=A0A0K0Y861_9RHOB|nr:ABC transporter substrate-binding protein [Octadecabacter temperatus]AKS47153.1 putative binding protein component of ABC iron transporter precursor [Octadecabacter temperatus]SIO45907.1 iron(III) transport system substrate-binding protein [Octadecabacter temperatus]
MRNMLRRNVLSTMACLAITVSGTAVTAQEATGQLTVYGSTLEDVVRDVAQAFEAKTGIETVYVRASTGETLNRIRAEQARPQASVWFGGPGDSYRVAQEEGLLEPYISPSAENIADQFKDPDGYWTGLYTSNLGFASNRGLLAERGIEVPTSWEDLLAPELEGLVAVANPATSGTAYAYISTIAQLMGEEEGFEYLDQASENIAQYTKSGSAPGRMAGSGEILVGILMLQDAYLIQQQGFDLELSTPSEGTGFALEPAAMLKDGPDQLEAQMFIDYILSAEGQSVMQEHFHLLSFTNPELSPRAEASALEDMVLIDYDFDWAGANKTRLIERFQNEILIAE